MSIMNTLEVKKLTKKFGETTAVDGISFSLKENEILGFLGPNGAGKTTTIQMLLGTLTPTSGQISYFGKNLKHYREEILEQVNFSSTYTKLPWRVTVKENLTFISYLYKIEDRKQRILELTKQFRLKELINKQVGSLSEGQKTRVNLAKAFINNPKVLLLDEPTASLDPEIAKEIRDFIIDYRNKNKVSILFTSHNMTEIENLCDRVIFINKGKLVADDTPENLASSLTKSHLNLFLKKDLERLLKLTKGKRLKTKVENKRVRIRIEEKQIPQFLNDLAKENIEYLEISIDKPTLEDYFLYLAKKTNATK